MSWEGKPQVPPGTPETGLYRRRSRSHRTQSLRTAAAPAVLSFTASLPGLCPASAAAGPPSQGSHQCEPPAGQVRNQSLPPPRSPSTTLSHCHPTKKPGSPTADLAKNRLYHRRPRQKPGSPTADVARHPALPPPTRPEIALHHRRPSRLPASTAAALRRNQPLLLPTPAETSPYRCRLLRKPASTAADSCGN